MFKSKTVSRVKLQESVLQAPLRGPRDYLASGFTVSSSDLADADGGGTNVFL